MLCMRTTVSRDDRLGEAAKRRAREQGLSLSAWIARAIEDLLTRSEQDLEAPPFRLVTVGGDGPQPGVDLDRISELTVADDERTYASEDG